jgi:hypothetical protein
MRGRKENNMINNIKETKMERNKYIMDTNKKNQKKLRK